MSPSAWITGAHGFLGRHLARACRDRGWAVAGVGHGAWDEGEAARWGLGAWVRGDVTAEALDELAEQAPEPDVLFHLAGGSAVGISIAAPEEDFRRTVASTEELLRWRSRAAPEAVVVLASSAAVYGAGPSGPIEESRPCAPCSPYGQHKRAAEMLALGDPGRRVAIARMFSVYGLHLRKQLLWDLCLRLARNPRELHLSGTGAETRDFLHAGDAVRLLLECAARPGLILNGGTGVATTVRELAERVVRAWGRDTPVRFSGTARPGDPESLVADTRAALAVGWSARITLDEGVPDYVAWFRGAAVPVHS